MEGEFSLRVEESDLPRIGAGGQDIAHLKAGPSQAVEVEVLLVVLVLEPEVPSPKVEDAEEPASAGGHHLRLAGLKGQIPDLKTAVRTKEIQTEDT